MTRDAVLAALAALVVGATAVPMFALAATPDPNVDPTVLVEDFAFQPAEVVAFVDQPVTWTIGSDPEQHTVTPTDGAGFDDSGQLFTGDTFTVRFQAPGTYEYLCTLHPFMTGTVTVVEASTQASPSVPVVTTSSSTGAGAAPSTPTSTAASAASPATSDPVDASGGSVPMAVLMIALLLVAALLAVVAALQRRRRA